MLNPGSPAEMRALIVERLVGETGEPDHVIEAARRVAERALPAIAAGLGEALSLTLSLEVKAVELARFASARPTAENNAMTVAASASSPDALILTMDAAALAIVISEAFGGDPATPFTPIDRGLSPTETEVATLVFDEIAKAINGSGTRAFEFTLPLPPAMTGLELVKHVIRDGPGVRAVFSIVTPSATGTIVLMMPQRVLLKHRGDTIVGAAANDPGPAPDWRQRFSEEVMRSHVELQATMPLGQLSLGQIAGMHVGQVLEFGEGAQSQAKLSARQKTLFVCELGKLGQNYTVRVKHPFDAGQDFIDGLATG